MKIKSYFFIGLLLISAALLKAQDTLYKTNGSKLIVKITEINSSEVKYKMLGTNSDLMVTDTKNNIHHICYANGSKEFYNTEVQQPVHQSPAESPDYVVKADGKPIVPAGEKIYGKNIVAINFFETFFTNFGLSYERVSADGKFSIKIPVSFGLGGKQSVKYYNPSNNDNIDYLTNKIYGTGLEINAYPIKFSRSGFYLGITGEYGTFNYYTYGSSLTPSPYYYGNALVKNVGIHYAGMFHMGGYVGLTDKILLGGKLGLGYKHQETIYVDYTRFKMSLDLNLAYRF